MPYVPQNDRKILDPAIENLSKAIISAVKTHNDPTAMAGSLNYSLTRLLQKIPRGLKEEDLIVEEIRYWVQPLLYGVLLDVALEHKRRVNTAYEAAQIVKSGDCFDTPYYTRLIEVVDEKGNIIGFQEIMVKRETESLTQDLLPTKVIAYR